MKFFLFSLLVLSTSLLNAQQFMTRTGHVHFFSETPMENIEAENSQMSGLLDASNGGFAFQVQMRAFHFEKALMEEHFNENYVESEKYPKA
ncbi:MAG: YceI family protein, partial [Bacteroidetes bacterium]|nr:YceI family protein [Bacteroidota bacterium]